jgi:hypothetical protein
LSVISATGSGPGNILYDQVAQKGARMIWRTRGIGRRVSRTARTVLASAASAIVLVQLTAAGATSQTLRASDGTVACLVSAAPDGPQGQSQLAVQVRAPGSPAAEVAVSLPAELRDFSSLPIRVVLLSPATSGSAPLQRLPVSFNAALEHPVIDNAQSADGFVRAVFPRDWVIAGTTILGERMVLAPNGTRVTSQTRCAITEADAAQWR